MRNCRAYWPLADPKNEPIARVREIREEIRRRVAELIVEEAGRDSRERDWRLLIGQALGQHATRPAFR